MNIKTNFQDNKFTNISNYTKGFRLFYYGALFIFLTLFIEVGSIKIDVFNDFIGAILLVYSFNLLKPIHQKARQCNRTVAIILILSILNFIRLKTDLPLIENNIKIDVNYLYLIIDAGKILFVLNLAWEYLNIIIDICDLRGDIKFKSIILKKRKLILIFPIAMCLYYCIPIIIPGNQNILRLTAGTVIFCWIIIMLIFLGSLIKKTINTLEKNVIDLKI